MLELFRRHALFLMLVALLIFVAMIWWGDPNRNDGRGGAASRIKIGEQSFTQSDINRLGSVFGMVQETGDRSLFSHLMEMASYDRRFELKRGEVPRDFIYNTLLMRQYAADMGVEVSDEQVVQEIATLPFLQKNPGQNLSPENSSFDQERFSALEKGLLPRYGLSMRDFYDFIADKLSLIELRELFSAGLRPSPTIAEKVYAEQFGVRNALALRVNAGALPSPAAPSDEQISAYHKDNTESLLTAEQRSVRYAFFPAPTLRDKAGKEVSKQEKLELEKAHRKRVTDFSNAVVEEDAVFAEVAEKQEVELKLSETFAPQKPAEDFKRVPGLIAAIFSRDPASPVSDPYIDEEGIYVFKLEEIIKPRPMTLAEASTEINRVLSEEAAQTQLREKTDALRGAYLAALKEHPEGSKALLATLKKSEHWEKNAIEVLKLDDFMVSAPPFKEQDKNAFAYRTLQMKVGELSSPELETESASFVHYISKDLAEDPFAADRKKNISARLEQTDAQSALQAWFLSVKEKALPEFSQEG